MRDLILHIGLHKTGTSYLQKLFLENRELLREAGIGLAPYQDPNTGTHHPMLAAMEREGVGRVFDKVAETEGERVLISAEELCIILEDPARARAIRDAAARHFNPRIVIFLRRQDLLKESVYAQIVKSWFRGTIQDDTHYDYDHDGRLRALEAVFGRENVVVRLYDADRGDLEGAFFAAVGVPLERSRLRAVQPQNVSTSRRKLLFLSHVPKPPETAPAQAQFPSRFLLRVVTASRAIADDGIRFMMSPEERRALVAAHLAGNESLVARHGITETAGFLELPDPDPAWHPPAPVERAEVRRLFREAIAALWTTYNPVAAARLSARIAGLFAGASRGLRAAEH